MNNERKETIDIVITEERINRSKGSYPACLPNVR